MKSVAANNLAIRDYFIWVLQNETGTIVVDTGYDAQADIRRDRPILRNPADALVLNGISADSVNTVILTHLHYDHGGTVDLFLHATIHLQGSEKWLITFFLSRYCERLPV